MVGAGVLSGGPQALTGVFKLAHDREHREHQRIGQHIFSKLVEKLTQRTAIGFIGEPEHQGPETGAQAVHGQDMNERKDRDPERMHGQGCAPAFQAQREATLQHGDGDEQGQNDQIAGAFQRQGAQPDSGVARSSPFFGQGQTVHQPEAQRGDQIKQKGAAQDTAFKIGRVHDLILP